MKNSRHLDVLINLAVFTLVIAALFFGKPVLMPVALAVLLSFLLSPVVNRLVRMGLGRTIAVVAVVLLVFSALGGMIWGVASQMSLLVDELPKYKGNIREKVIDLRSAGKGSMLERIQQTLREIKGEIKQAEKTNQVAHVAGGETKSSASTPAPEPEPVPVVVQGQGTASVWQTTTAIQPLMEMMATAGLVIVLVIFMLLRKRELRNRFIILFGLSRMPTTTRALEEAAERISRYLLMQTTINSGYGLAVGTGLYFLGLPYALLWGGMSAVLRFIPYVGAWLGATLPVLLSLAVFPGWLHPFLVLGLILVLELLNNMLVEPLLYGHSAGVSEVALLVAVAFWTWIWGGIGLALATPLTVCLVVLSKHVPGLSFINLLLGDAAVMDSPTLFYQRLLAMDKMEAEEVACEFKEKHTLLEFYDYLLMPALINARRDFKRETLSDSHLQFIVSTTEKLMEKICAKSPELEEETSSTFRGHILIDPIDDFVDELIAKMLGRVLPPSLQVEIVSSQTLTGEIVERAERDRPAVICLAALSPGGSAELKLLAKKLTTLPSGVNVVIGRWGLLDTMRIRELSAATGVATIASTLSEARNMITQLARINPEPNGEAAGHSRTASVTEPTMPEARLN
jgi:predicted PurR-regulated permease PerM